MREPILKLPTGLRDPLNGVRGSTGVLLRLLAGLLVVGLLAGGAVGWRSWQQHRAELARAQARDQAAQAATAFLEAWEQGRYEQLPDLAASPPDGLAEQVRSTMRRLRASRLQLEAGSVSLADPERPDTGAEVAFTALMRLGGLGDWRYRGSLTTVPGADQQTGDEADRWVVEWQPTSLHPALSAGQRLERRVSQPQPAPVLAAGGEPIQPDGTQLTRIVEGLERLFQDRLTGAASGEVLVAGGDGAPVEVLESFPGRDPQPLPTGLDPSVQRAAEQALATAPGTAAMVVLDARSKAIRAVVNDPPGFDRALAGQYAPGSTFKVVTTLALLRQGVEPSTATHCPPAVDIGGREFTNYEGAAYGTIPFRRAFFLSCNTVFVQQAAQLPEGALTEAARTLGFNLDWTLGIADPYNSFPEPQDAAETAAAAFGQGRVAASPVQMASVAAAVASGAWDNPWLAVPQRDQLQARELGPAAQVIADLMQEVPRRGTASGAGLSDGVAGKTGTAEVRRGGALVNDTWFIGFDPRGGGETLAWAVLVESGRSGGSTAAPVAAAFLDALGRD